MPPLEALGTFSLVAFLLIVVPGPSVLFVIGRSLSLGRRGGLLSVLGNELGALPLVAAVALGVGAIVAESILIFTTVKLLGAAYLIYLGVQAIRHRRVDFAAAGRGKTTTRESGWKTVGQGAIVGITNPKTIVFFVAALPQFVDFQAGSVPLQMMVLGLVFTVIAFICDAVWAVLAGTARTWFASSPQRVSRIRVAGGGMMIALGGTMALTSNKA